MKRFFSSMTWVLLGVGCLCSCQWAPSTASTVENYWLKGDTILIRLRDGAGWRLDLYQEGRGSIRYGRHPNNVLTIERTDLDFDSLRRQLAARMAPKKAAVSFSSASVAFLVGDVESEQSRILRDTELARQVFDLALEAGLNGRGELRAKRRMYKLYKSNPPFGN